MVTALNEGRCRDPQLVFARFDGGWPSWAYGSVVGSIAPGKSIQETIDILLEGRRKIRPGDDIDPAPGFALDRDRRPTRHVAEAAVPDPRQVIPGLFGTLSKPVGV